MNIEIIFSVLCVSAAVLVIRKASGATRMSWKVTICLLLAHVLIAAVCLGIAMQISRSI